MKHLKTEGLVETSTIPYLWKVDITRQQPHLNPNLSR